MEELISLLQRECDYSPDSKQLTLLLNSMDEVQFMRKEVVIAYGELNPDVYIVKAGICRLAYFDGDKEVTFAFASSGNMMLSPHCYYKDKPAFMQVECCTDTVLLRLSRERFNSLIYASQELTRWMYEMAMSQLCTLEKKLEMFNGRAKERYISMLAERPEIVRSVTDKMIASYIGVTQQYLSKIKRLLLKTRRH